MTTEALDAINAVGEAHERFTNKYGPVIDGLDDRLGALEALGDRPRAPGGGGKVLPYRRYESGAGAIFELPPHAKMADIAELRPAKMPAISLERWLAAIVQADRCGDREAVQFANEHKQMTTGSTGVLVPQEFQTSWIDLLRAQSVLVRAGMRTVSMTARTQTASAVTGDPQTQWHQEATADINANNPTFEARVLTARTLATRCTASLELSQDSPDFGSQLANVMTKAMAATIDHCGLEGSGSATEPRGILHTSGRSTQTNSGALTSYSKLVTGLQTLLAENADLAQISRYAVMSPGCWGQLEGLVTGLTSDKTQLRRPDSIRDMQFLVTTGVSGNVNSSPQIKTAITLGDFRDLLLGVRLESSIEILKLTTYATSLLLEFIGHTRADFVCTRPASFHTIEGVIA